MDDEIRERERRQMEQILQLDDEELLVEEVDDLDESSDEDCHATGRDSDGASTSSGYTCLASLHTYLGDVEDKNHSVAFACLDGGDILNIPIFCLEGVVLFPRATLPLRVTESNFVAAIERVLTRGDEPNTFGVVRAQINGDNRRIKLSTVGTTAEIRQYQRLDDGSANVVCRGQQRFRLRHRWFDANEVPFGEIQIIQEEFPLRTPPDALGVLAPYRSPQGCIPQYALPSNASVAKLDGDVDRNGDAGLTDSPVLGKRSWNGERRINCWRNSNMNQLRGASGTFWPSWVYRMYDSYSLAQRASDLWKRIVGTPSMDGLLKQPDLLSYCIASKIPVSESTRQELLEIDGISYRLRREIELLESLDLSKVEYDPRVIGFRELLEVFWSRHDSRQVFGQGTDEYRIQVGCCEQRREQIKSKASIVTTQILPLGTFYRAEPEHQKVELKRNPFLLQLIGDLAEEELEASSLATTLDGYAAELCPPKIQNQIDAKVNDIIKKGWPILREV